MYDDAEARKTVRSLMKRMDEVAGLSLGIAYVLARRNPQEYAKLLESAERARELVIQPIMAGEADLNRVYAALDDPSANWCDAITAMLASPGESWIGNEARERMEFMIDLDARFDAAERQAEERKEGDPGLGS